MNSAGAMLRCHSKHKHGVYDWATCEPEQCDKQTGSKCYKKKKEKKEKHDKISFEMTRKPEGENDL